MTATHRSANYSKPAQLDMPGLANLLFGHAAFQYLQAACELNVLETVRTLPDPTKEKLREALGLEERAADILLLGVTALGLLVKDNEVYHVADVVRELMDTDDWQRFKDTVAFEHYIVYEGQIDFTESLQKNTNVGLRRFPGEGRDIYH
ncbi:methyltransferase family protein, partial [Lonsdalea populi]